MSTRKLYAIAMIGAVALLGWQTTKGQGAKPKDEMMELYGLFVDAVEQVEENYVRPVSRKELLESALRGMLSDLDPHSSYINTSQWKDFRKTIEGRFGGIGISVGMDPELNRLQVMTPMVGTPAYAAGVMAGDVILDIDGKTTEGLDPERAVEVLQGRPGTEVKLTVLHETNGKTETLTMNRAIIEIPSVLGDSRKPDDTWDFMIDKENKIGYIRIAQFVQNTTDEVKAALTDLTGAGMKGLILDLRDDPGGMLSSAVEVSDLFLEEGQIVSTKGRSVPPRSYEAEKVGTFTGFPIVVLVNQNSASASEIVSAALQDQNRAVVVGQRSFGKGSVQTLLPLSDDTALRLTTARYYTPSGRSVQENGIEPDIIVPQLSDPLAADASRPRLREADLRRHLINEVKATDKLIEADDKPDPRFADTVETLKKKGITDYQLSYAVKLIERLVVPAAAPTVTAAR